MTELPCTVRGFVLERRGEHGAPDVACIDLQASGLTPNRRRANGTARAGGV